MITKTTTFEVLKVGRYKKANFRITVFRFLFIPIFKDKLQLADARLSV